MITTVPTIMITDILTTIILNNNREIIACKISNGTCRMDILFRQICIWWTEVQTIYINTNIYYTEVLFIALQRDKDWPGSLLLSALQFIRFVAHFYFSAKKFHRSWGFSKATWPFYVGKSTVNGSRKYWTDIAEQY